MTFDASEEQNDAAVAQRKEKEDTTRLFVLLGTPRATGICRKNNIGED
jgi:hypothetical protein